MFESFRPQYRTHLPTPLARFYYRACDDDLRVAQGNLTCLFEAIVKLAVIPALMEYVHCVKQNPGARDRQIDRAISKLHLPSLGDWKALLQGLAKYFSPGVGDTHHSFARLWSRLKQKHSDRPGILRLHRKINEIANKPVGNTTCSLLELIDVLTNYRNKVAHAVSERRDELLKELVPVMLEGMNELLEDLILECFQVSNGGFVLIHDISQLNSRQSEIRMWQLVGDNPIKTTIRRTVSAQQAAHLHWPSIGFLGAEPAPPLSLSPLLMCKDATAPARARILVFNGADFRPKSGPRLNYACFDQGDDDRGSPIEKEAVAELFESFGKPQAPVKKPSIGVGESLLPYMVDRDAQEWRIQEALEQEMETGQPRAVVIVLSGDETQCHDEFKDRLVDSTLRRVYGLRAEDKVDGIRVDFPAKEHKEDDFVGALRWNVANKLSLDSRSLKDLANRLSDGQVLVYFGSSISGWNKDRERQMDWFLRFWQELPRLWRKPPPVICFSLKYKCQTDRNFWGRRRHARQIDRAKKWLAQLNSADYREIRLEIMPELPSVNRDDVDVWLEHFGKNLDRFANTQMIRSRLDKLFDQSDELPMRRLAEELLNLDYQRDAA